MPTAGRYDLSMAISSRRTPGSPNPQPGNSLGVKARQTRQTIITIARQILLENGYAGTRIEQITNACGISRASFYTYFPTKAALLTAMAEDSAATGKDIAARLDDLSADDHEGLVNWIGDYMGFMDRHGAFVYLWDQVGADKPQMRELGLQLRLSAAEALGDGIMRLRGSATENRSIARVEGLAVLAMLERFWYLWRVAKLDLDRSEVLEGISRVLAGPAR